MTLIASDRQAAMAQAFPTIAVKGARVEPSAHVEPGTGLMASVAFAVAIVIGLVGTLITWGIFLGALLLGVVIDLIYSRRVLAMIRGSAVEVGPKQLSEIDACVREFAERLGLKRAPAVFVLQQKSLNALAMRIGSRQVVILLDDVVDACLRSGNPRALAFVIGHEMAHHALGHTGRLRSYLRTIFKRLSRLDEHSCDNVAAQLVGDADAAAAALTVLTAGPAMVPYIDRLQLLVQAQDVEADPLSRKAEKKLSHPLLLRRLARCAK
jgi:Zn-dependent protease with chaperone function